MKKKIIFYVCMALLMISAAVTTVVIVKVFSNKYETEETKAFREVLTLLENNRDKSNKKGYDIKFSEDFSYEQKIEENDNIIDYSSHYKSEGVFNLSYETADPKSVSIGSGFESFFNNSTGFMLGNQSEQYEIHNVETDKDSNNASRTDDLKYKTNNNFIIENDQNNISVMSETTYSDLKDSNNDVNDKFYGKIAKSVLNDNIESKSFNTAVDQILFVDAWDSTNTLLMLLHNTFKDLDSNDFEKIYNYIKNKNFSYNKTDNSIVVKYEISINPSLKEEDNDFKNAELELEVDNKTGEIIRFKIDLSKFLESILGLEAEGSTYFKSEINSYVIEGKIINNTLTKADTSSIVYKEFGSEDVYDFIDQFINHALPTREDVY